MGGGEEIVNFCQRNLLSRFMFDNFDKIKMISCF